MFELLLKTRDFMDLFARKEISMFYSNDFKVLDKDLYLICFEDKDEMIKFVYDVLFYFRCFERVFLKICDFKSLEDIKSVDLGFIEKSFTFEVDSQDDYKDDKKEAEKYFGSLISKNSNLSVDLSRPDLSFKVFSRGNISYLGLDLLGFDLSKRDFKLNVNHNTINSLLGVYCLYLLGIDCEKKFSIIDPASGLGDLIIEASMFNMRKPFNVKKRSHVSIFRIFGVSSKMPALVEDKNKFVAIVQNNKNFKLLKENISYCGAKVKISQYELDWLDVKFRDSEIDYLIMQVPMIHEKGEYDKFLEDFFYQAEFITKKKIILLSKKKIDKSYHEKYDTLELKKFENIKVGKQDYFIYLFSLR
jgi:23S rRNA G2445 N2-methylase RlmL